MTGGPETMVIRSAATAGFAALALALGGCVVADPTPAPPPVTVTVPAPVPEQGPAQPQDSDGTSGSTESDGSDYPDGYSGESGSSGVASQPVTVISAPCALTLTPSMPAPVRKAAFPLPEIPPAATQPSGTRACAERSIRAVPERLDDTR